MKLVAVLLASAMCAAVASSCNLVTGASRLGAQGGDATTATAAGGGAGGASTSPAGGAAGHELDAGPGGAGGHGGAAPTGDCAVLGPWSSTTAFGGDTTVSHPFPSFAVGTIYAVLTTNNPYDSGQNWIYSARQAPDGSLGLWQRSDQTHGGHQGFSATTIDGTAYMFRNGHIAYYPQNPDGSLTGAEVCTEDSMTATFGGHLWMWDSHVYAPFPGGAKWVVHLSGFDMAPHDYRHDLYIAPVPVPKTFTDTGQAHPGVRPGKSAFFVPAGATAGFIYVSEAGSGPLWRGRLDEAGALSGWDAMPDMPAGTGNERGDLFVARHTLFVVRGSRVFAANLDAAGTLGGWQEMPSLPEDQIDMTTWGGGENEGASYGIIGDFVYLTGQRRVHYATILPHDCG